MQFAAEVAVDVPFFAIDQPYTYLIPQEINASIKPGTRVIVPFGRGNSVKEGIVLSLSDAPSDKPLKSIHSCMDESPVLSPSMLRLAVWMHSRYFCTVYEAVHAILPTGLWFQIQEYYSIIHPDEDIMSSLSDDEKTALDTIRTNHNRCSAEILKNVLADKQKTVCASLEKKGLVCRSSDASAKVKAKTADYVELSVTAEEARAEIIRRQKKAPMQAEVLRMLSALECISVSELRQYTGVSTSSLKALEKHGFVEIKPVTVFRTSRELPSEELPIPPLTPEQMQVFSSICTEAMKQDHTSSLIQGVTGSGKTTVYLHLIQKNLSEGRSVILLVPEIALTPQMIRIFSAHFGSRVAVLHSSLSLGERFDEWNRINAGLATVVIGTRSAVFAPCHNLGLIIIDEEHEATYKSENSPRYHAREVAMFRCKEESAHLILGSATPDIETRYRAETGLYKHFILSKRYNDRPMPSVQIVDMKKELRNDSIPDFSSLLINEIASNIRKGEQTILFMNRRGFAKMISCSCCGFTFMCPNCSVSLTWHSDTEKLVCHYCGHTEYRPSVCPECRGKLIQYGSGTQKITEELGSLFPETEILRLDADSVTKAGSHQRLLTDFEEKNIPILIGTQMVTKGLDFENVTLVGVISADQMLYNGNYRSAERCFSLITQVIGRAGRAGKDGRAVIQTFTPENPVIQLASRQDYDSFYQQEKQMRFLQNMPPFSEPVVISVHGAVEADVIHCCRFLYDVITNFARNYPKVHILGPAPYAITKVNNQFRYKITIQCMPNREFRHFISVLLVQCGTAKEFKGLSVFADINPME